MTIPLDGFIGGAYSLPSGRNIASQRCINLYLETIEVPDKSQSVLINTPGLSLFSTYTSLGNDSSVQNGLYTSSTGRLFRIVSGYLRGFTDGNILELTAGGSVLPVSGIVENYGNPVVMADNGSWIFIAQSSADPIRINMATLSAYSTADATISLCAATHVVYLDGYFIINKAGSNVMYASPVSWDGVALWNPLSFASADQSPDNIVGLIVCGRDLWVFGVNTFEIWYDAGTTPFPFARNISIAGSIGLYAKYSLAQLQGSVFWLGSGAEGYGVIYRSVGYTPTRISTHAIEQEIRSYAGISDAYGFTYAENGHFFYVLTFQTGNATWVYDLATGAWHQRVYTNPTTGAQERWRAIGAASFNGSTYVLDRLNLRKTYKLSNTVCSDDGNPIVRIRSSPHSFASLDLLFFRGLQIDMQVGVGLTSGQGADPKISLRWSNDGGNVWSNFYQRSFGKIGEWLTRVYWGRLGCARNRVWEISISDPVPVKILGAWVDVDKGDT